MYLCLVPNLLIKKKKIPFWETAYLVSSPWNDPRYAMRLRNRIRFPFLILPSVSLGPELIRTMEEGLMPSSEPPLPAAPHFLCL